MFHSKRIINNKLLQFRTESLIGVVKNFSHPRCYGDVQYSTATKVVKCWKCGHQSESNYALFCDKCNIVQAPHERDNYFRVLDVTETYDLDEKTLTEKYRTLQSQLHPDKFTNRTAQERDISQDYSSLINQAHKILQSPLKRAVHLLRLKGYDVSEDEKLDNQQFLMEIMELNEQVEQADTPEKLKELHDKNKRVLIESATIISDCFKRGDLKRAKETVVKMKYYNSVMSYINNLLRERGIVD